MRLGNKARWHTYRCFSARPHLTDNGFKRYCEEEPKPHLLKVSYLFKSDADFRNVYVSAAFLLAYMAWLVISIAAYIDTKKLHADFMYWIVEEKISMRSKVNASSERSDRSSKGSKISNRSRTSNRSNRSNQSIKSERFYSERSAGRASPADVRLSVPL
ncbi:hypothetical protein GCK32_004861 [Trichostrongylus colubriformis]|uniref:Uncharacterized protein n=1 Tax=Trichostrongylus colubriformis TaxID=6319 RepID=A0AAN8EYA1_TRICO